MHLIGQGIGKCSLQKWQGHLAEYSVPNLTLPMIAMQSGGRVKIRRVRAGKDLSDDYVMPGELIIVPKNTSMRWHVNGEVDVSVLMFENPDTCEHIQRLYERVSSQTLDPVSVCSFANPYIFTTTNHLLGIAEKNDMSQDYLDAQFRALEMYVLRFLGQDNEGIPAQRDSYSYHVSYLLQRFTLGLKNRVLVESVAQEIGVSAAYLNRKFKQEVGVSPHHFLLVSRLKRAQKLLAETDLDILAIAEQTGFSDQSHLTRHFSKEYGVSPFRFRRELREKSAIL